MRIVINMDLGGSFEVATDEPAEVFVVCEHTPSDRVYRLGPTHTVGRETVDAILRDDPVGHAGDDRHEAVKHRLLAAEAGERHLKPV